MELESFSQDGQDKYIYQTYFRNDNEGFFIEIGADDGVDKSNTYLFEKQGWKGICVEPSPERFEQLSQNRKCICVNKAIAEEEGTVEFLDIHGYGKGLSGIVNEYHPKHIERIERELTGNPDTIRKKKIRVQTTPLQSILDMYNCNHINYCSIDVEGGELAVIKSIDFSQTQVDIFTIEDNYREDEIPRLMRELGYSLTKRMGGDCLYVHHTKLRMYERLFYRMINLI